MRRVCILMRARTGTTELSKPHTRIESVHFRRVFAADCLRTARESALGTRRAFHADLGVLHQVIAEGRRGPIRMYKAKSNKPCLEKMAKVPDNNSTKLDGAIGRNWKC